MMKGPLIAATYAAQRYQPPFPLCKIPRHPSHPFLSAESLKIKRRRIIPGHGSSFDRQPCRIPIIPGLNTSYNVQGHPDMGD